MLQIQILQKLDQIHQSTASLEDHERRFNRHAQPILQHPQYQAHLIQAFIKTLSNKDLRRSLRNRYKAMVEENEGFLTLITIQQEARFLNRKFNSVDAFRELYALRQDPHTPITVHNYEIERRLALLEVPMEDDLLQDLYRKSIRPDLAARLAQYSFNSYVDLRNAAIRLSGH